MIFSSAVKLGISKRSSMKRLIPAVALVILTLAGAATAKSAAEPQGRPNIFAPQGTASGPLVAVVNAIVTAFNNRDTAYFQKTIAPDTVWFDEDGHHLNALVWMNRVLSSNPPRKLSISNLRVANWDDGGWAGFNYVVAGANQDKGVTTLVFKKNGNDWQIVLIHAAMDTAPVAH